MANQDMRDDDLLLYQIAKMYYIDGLSQDAIANVVNFSRSYVSRLLDKAKERKLVTFTVTNPLEQTIEGLIARLRELYGLKFVVIEGVSSSEYQGGSGRSLIECIADRAALCLPGFLATSNTVAVGFGETLYRMSKTLQEGDHFNNMLVIPAIGTTVATGPQTQSNIIVDNISSALGARRYFTNVPIVVDSIEAQSTLYQRRYRELSRIWETVDTAIIGLGAPYRTKDDPFSLNEATEEYRELVASTDTVGDILASFFFEDGTELDLGGRYIRNTIGLDRLRDIDRVLCVAGGPRKVRGIWSALRNGFINCLVTDSMTAAAIIGLEEAATPQP